MAKFNSKIDFNTTIIDSTLGYFLMYCFCAGFHEGAKSGYTYSRVGMILAFLVYIIRLRSYRDMMLRRFKSTLLIVTYVVAYCLILIFLFHKDTKNIVPYISCLAGLVLLGYFLRNKEQDERFFLLCYLGMLWFLLTCSLDRMLIFTWLSAGTGLFSMEVLKKRVRDGDYEWGKGYRQTSVLLCSFVVVTFMIMNSGFWGWRPVFADKIADKIQVHASITALYFIISYFFCVEYILFVLDQCEAMDRY